MLSLLMILCSRHHFGLKYAQSSPRYAKEKFSSKTFKQLKMHSVCCCCRQLVMCKIKLFTAVVHFFEFMKNNKPSRYQKLKKIYASFCVLCSMYCVNTRSSTHAFLQQHMLLLSNELFLWFTIICNVAYFNKEPRHKTVSKHWIICSSKIASLINFLRNGKTSREKKKQSQIFHMPWICKQMSILSVNRF